LVGILQNYYLCSPFALKDIHHGDDGMAERNKQIV